MKTRQRVKVMRVRVWSGDRKRLLKKQVKCSGSPDSEVVASYLEKFAYQPEKCEQVREKYVNLIKSDF